MTTTSPPSEPSPSHSTSPPLQAEAIPSTSPHPKMAHPFGTFSVALATTPTVVSTFFSHILSRRRRRSAARKSIADGGAGGGPEAELSYEEGLKVVRRFIEFASHRGVEEVQAFTAMQVPTPHWVRRKTVTIPQPIIERAETILAKHLSSYGPDGTNGGGLKLVGGERWWRVRGRALEGEWVEMQKDYLRRKANADQKSTVAEAAGAPSHRSYLPIDKGLGAEVIGDRVILYVHGGAFFFSSLDTHRYQVQRHARKAGARAFCPAYRLAPQYPFPCGILDALASYLYLLYPPAGAHQPILPTSIILMGDSAGAGMVLSLLIVIREMGLPMPAGASLISPWVDLTHSMPSIGGWDGGDFIPSSGFHYKPSAAWPPLAGDGITVTMPDGTDRHFDEQIQMYCPNDLLTHPLISLVNQGSLGGLCPLLIIIYLAHKAAEPMTYPPSSSTLSQYPDQAALANRYKPTKVHLQIYEGCCHVVPTLSWTRSSKYMYRACANFNIWAFTAAAKALEHGLKHKHSGSGSKEPSRQSTLATEPIRDAAPNGFSSTAETRVETATPSPAAPVSGALDGSAPSSAGPSTVDLTRPIINSSAASQANAEEVDLADLESEASSESDDDAASLRADASTPATGIVTVSGAEPMFGSKTIVSERVSTHGRIRPFEPIAEVPALDPGLREHIGQVHGGGAIQEWLKKRAEWDDKYESSLITWREVRKVDRERAEKEGFLSRDLHGERPPLASLAGWWDQEIARGVGKSVDEISRKTSGAVMMWMKMSSKADKERAGGENLEEIKETVQAEMEEEKEEKQGVASRRRSSVAARRQSIVQPQGQET
ncbi:hypothetical protein EHS25_007828 [Saitozyma podzolica]|uniref:Alpha/beta hydrolase fold-3 domain-containing protein n=1 Tax=Saitozyma podzolica TaxID=1890683 RepID=A0A427YQW4_9TREE|nr:hypothetical protein EHS25_007828 [Saitozyma podzolica]